MKRSHALIGAAAGVAVAHATGAPMLAGGIVAGLAGLLPDIDHPHAAVGRMLPRWWHRLTPGHRGPTHSLVWCLALAVVAGVGWWVGHRLTRRTGLARCTDNVQVRT